MLFRTRTASLRMACLHFSSTAFWRMTALASLLLALASPGWAARHALVIGNASYAERPLKNPVNDASDLAKALEGAGFKVTLKTNLSADAMKEAISEFGDALRRSPDNTGLFYFSGHGVQTPKGNYLLPVGRAFKRTKDVELFAVEARAVLAEMQAARNPLNILILDACRDSPLPGEDKSLGGDAKGLGRMDAPSGSLIAFAAAPGKTASDNGTERNGLYTKHLIDAINTPGLRLEDVFKRVGARVEKESLQKGAEQSPEEVSKLRSEVPFYFRGGSPAAVSSTASQASGPAPLPVQVQPQLAAQPVPSTPQAPPATQAKAFKDCAECPEMVVIPAGNFQMGSEESDDSGPVHRVNVKSFALGKFEVTQRQWKALMGANPSDNTECGDNCPVESVSWRDAQEFVQKLSQKTGQAYRLPTEAEWEYAARAGTTTKWSFGNSESELSKYAWFKDNSYKQIHQVGKALPNAFGLHDMHGNVLEWVQDVWQSNYNGAPADGSARLAGGFQSPRVVRGGAFSYSAGGVSSAYRDNLPPEFQDIGLGFRVARTLP